MRYINADQSKPLPRYIAKISEIDKFAASSYHHILFFNEYRKNLRVAGSYNKECLCSKY